MFFSTKRQQQQNLNLHHINLVSTLKVKPSQADIGIPKKAVFMNDYSSNNKLNPLCNKMKVHFSHL